MIFNQQNRQSIRTKELLSHHDVVFRAPVCDPVYGLPIGDGDTGCLIWMSEDALHVNINNTAFIDDLGEGILSTREQEVKQATLCGGAELTIHMGCPVYSTFYQEQFEARISLGDGSVSIQNETPFVKTDLKAFASHDAKATVLMLDVEFEEPREIRSDLKRWGSRAFHYFGYYEDIKDMRLSGTDSYVDQNCLCVTQQLTGNNFCVAVKPVTVKMPAFKTAGKHAAEVIFTEEAHVQQIYYIATAVGKTVEEAREEALKRVQNAQREGKEDLYAQHAKAWEEFWNKSYVFLPKEQDFLENLWYINLYIANSEMRGTRPARPWQGIWQFSHDFAPWPGYLHYNMQYPTFPLEASNHPELTETYYRFYRNILPVAEAYAREYKHSKGALYTEHNDMMGRMIPDINYTPGAQIAMAMYEHYCYTGDEAFLQDTALPVMTKVGEFYLDQLQMGEDGYYHIYGTSAYESDFMEMDDTITDLVMIRVLFGTLIKLLPQEETAVYQERLDKLVPFQTTDFLPGEVDENGILQGGIGKGKKIATDKVLSVGDNARVMTGITVEFVEQNANDILVNCFGKVRELLGSVRTRKTFALAEYGYYGQPDWEISPVFPAGLLGIKDRGSELYNLVINSIYMNGEKPFYWSMLPIYLARMGIKDLLKPVMDSMINNYILFPQGFCGLNNLEFPQRWDWSDSRDMNDSNKKHTKFSKWNFRHFDYETTPILSAAVNEMLLQSYDGIVRLFPAVEEDCGIAFKLAATGGRIVEAIYDAGECDVLITCVRGGELRVAVENVKSVLTFRNADDGQVIHPREEEGVYVLDTKAGQQISLQSAEGQKVSLEKDYSRNTDVKYHGSVKLGTEAEF